MLVHFVPARLLLDTGVVKSSKLVLSFHGVISMAGFRGLAKPNTLTPTPAFVYIYADSIIRLITSMDAFACRMPYLSTLFRCHKGTNLDIQSLHIIYYCCILFRVAAA